MRAHYVPFLTPLRNCTPERWHEEAKGDGESMFTEYIVLCMNPRSTLFRKGSMASIIEEDGDGLRFVQDWLGHANIQNTAIYTELVSGTRVAKARQHFLKLPKF